MPLVPGRTFVDPGDRLRLTRPLVQAVLQAVKAGEDHVVLVELCRDEQAKEVTLQVRRGARLVPEDA